MFLKLYNYFVRGIFIFLFIGMTVSLIINPEIIEDENDIYFFIASYITILVFYFGWGYVYKYLGRKRKWWGYDEYVVKEPDLDTFL